MGTCLGIFPKLWCNACGKALGQHLNSSHGQVFWQGVEPGWWLRPAGYRKDGRSVRFPPELQLAREWMSDQSDHVRGATLDLIATVAHHGKTMQSGHYTVRSADSPR